MWCLTRALLTWWRFSSDKYAMPQDTEGAQRGFSRDGGPARLPSHGLNSDWHDDNLTESCATGFVVILNLLLVLNLLLGGRSSHVVIGAAGQF